LRRKKRFKYSQIAETDVKPFFEIAVPYKEQKTAIIANYKTGILAALQISALKRNR
jgi:hypothetical protein